MSKRVRAVEEKDVDAELLESIKTRRKGNLLNLDKVLLHSENVAKGWNHMFGAIRNTAKALERESCILLIAVINKAEYEWEQHESPFIAAGGSEAMLSAIRQQKLDDSSLSESQQAALELAREMTEKVEVSEDTFARVTKSLNGNEKDLVELIAAIAGYNMVSRMLVCTNMLPEK